MYSHTFNNPNNIKITNLDDFNVIPFGNRCHVTSSCIHAKLRVDSLPFDWICHTMPSTIKTILENNFNDFIPDVLNGSFRNKYDILFPHFDKDLDKGIIDTNKHIEKFKIMLTSSSKIYFIHSSFDYMVNKSWRTSEFNHNLMSNFVDLDYFLKEKYPHLNYTIIVFTFKKYEYLPKNSNIIQIVLKCVGNDNIDVFNQWNYNSQVEFTKIMTELVQYCGNILKDLFKVQKTS